MGIFDKFIAFIVKKFWPWFKDYVWPIVKERVIALILSIIDFLMKKIKELFSQRFEKRQEEAQKKAEEAEEKSKNTKNANDAEKYSAIAQVWREVAEQFRRDNEELKAKLEKYQTNANAMTEEVVNETDIDVDFSKTRPILTIGDKKNDLPPLLPQ